MSTTGAGVEAEVEPPKESRLKSLLRAAAQYSAGSMITMIASIARVGITARVLSETEIGVWLGLQLLLSYAGNLHLGVLYGIYRSVPMLRGQGKHDEAEREKQTAFTFVAIMTVVGAIALGVLAPRITQASSAKHIALTMALVVANLLRMYWSTAMRAESRFKELSVAWLLGALASFVGLIAIVKWGLEGVLIAMLAQAVVETAFIATRLGVPRLALDKKLLKAQLRIGIMTLLTTVGVIALTTADRSVMLQFCGVKQTGLYYLGANIGTLVPTIALVPTAVLTPQFFERAGRGEDLMPLVDRPLKMMAVFVAALCGVGAALLPAAVHRVWPNLIGGIPAALLALFLTCPVILSGLVTNVFYALDVQGRHVTRLIVSAASAYVLGGLGVWLMHGDIAGAVIGTTIAVLGYYIAVTISAMQLIPGQTGAGGLRMALVSLVPSVCVVGILGAVTVVFPQWLRGDIVGVGIALAGTALGTVPFLPQGLRALRGVRATRTEAPAEASVEADPAAAPVASAAVPEVEAPPGTR